MASKKSTKDTQGNGGLISIEVIAGKAGVSVTTVSMVLNGQGDKYRISKATQERIRVLATELNYAPNPAARNLRMRRTNSIGLVITDLSNYFFTELAKHLERICRANGYLLQISDSGDDDAVEEAIIRSFTGKSVDGMIVATSHQDAEFLTNAARYTPTVFIDRKLAGDHCSWVTSDNYHSALELMRRLLADRPREMAYIGGTRTLSSNVERFHAYEDALREAGVPKDDRLVVQREFTRDAGYTGVCEVVDYLGRRPDALFAASLALLEGALAALRDRFGRPPADMILGCFDDHPLLNYVAPSIHSVRQDCETIARQAFDILDAHMSGDQTSRREEVPARLIIREDAPIS